MTDLGRILLVDDEPSVLEMTAELLAMAGYAVVPESRGRAAIERLAAGEAFDALVTDQSMPEMTGEEVILRARLIAPALPCLLVTGHGTNTELADEFTVLRKPYRGAQLAAAIEALLRAPPETA
jgi:CheY-like chemotaxis protein